MTNPSDPGQPARPPAGGQPPGGPYGPPPPPHPQQQQQHQHGTGPIPVPNPRPPAAPPGQGHGQGQPNPNQPGPGPYATGPQPQVPPQGWVPPERTEPGLLGALFDTNFNSLVTPKLIKAFYVMSLVLISFSALIIVAIGLWVFQLRNGWLVGLLIMFSAPVAWFFEAMLCRIFMEAVMTRFKSVEYLRVIKDKS